MRNFQEQLFYRTPPVAATVLFTRFPSKHVSRSFEDFSEGSIRSSMLSKAAYGVVPSA